MLDLDYDPLLSTLPILNEDDLNSWFPDDLPSPTAGSIRIFGVDDDNFEIIEKEPDGPSNQLISDLESTIKFNSATEILESMYFQNPPGEKFVDTMQNETVNKKVTTRKRKTRQLVNRDEEDEDNMISKLSMFSKLPNGNYLCNICYEKNVKTEEEDRVLVVRHIIRAHAIFYDFECSNCPKTFKEEEQLDQHTYKLHHRSTTETERYECNKCSHRSETEYLMKLHILRKHASAYKHVCKCCAKCFKSWSARKKHELRNGAQKVEKVSYMCTTCREIVETKEELAAHLEEKHYDFLDDSRNVKEVKYSCNRCLRFFESHKSLAKHKESCNERKKPVANFSCDKCDRKFTKAELLKKHELVHRGERPHECPRCGLGFKKKSVMRKHIMTHSGIRPYVCTFCSIGFPQRNRLMSHWKKEHSEVPPPPAINVSNLFDENGELIVSEV